jgi:glucose/arabinose dehydrogenase
MRFGSASIGFITASVLIALAGCSANGIGSAPTTLNEVSSSTQAQAASAPASTTSQRRTVKGFAPPITSGATLFSDDFENGSLAGWTPHNGSTWSICQPPGSSHELCTPGAAAATDALISVGTSAWSDYEVDAWTVLGSASRGGVDLIGRYADASHFYELELRNLNGQNVWAIYKNAGATWTKLAGGPISYVADRYYHLRLILNGTTLTAYATSVANDFALTSDTKLGSATDATYASGAIGARAIGGMSARFDNVAVYAAGVPAAVSPQAPPVNAALAVPSGFYAEVIAQVAGARELAAASNGDLLVGTSGKSIAIVPNAENDGAASAPQTLITLPEAPAEGIALGPNSTLYAGTNTGVWAIPYTPGTLSAQSAKKIAAIRTGPISPGSDGDVHTSSSVIVSGKTLYVGIGSSCNACVEVDPTRASVQAMNLDGSAMHTYATRIRNPIAFTTNPASGTVFTGGAGQDDLAVGHPYEYLDALTAHPAVADYGWPVCEENRIAYTAGADCSKTVVPTIEFPAYSTIIGAAYYPANAMGTYLFPASFRGGIFVSMHGSWHATGNVPTDPPHVAFVPMNGDAPAKPVNWNDPSAQWTDFFTGFQGANGNRSGRTTGIAVGPRGSLFVADDQTGTIFRIRPGVRP